VCCRVIVYGPQTTLVLAHNTCVDIFIEAGAREFLLIEQGAKIAPDTPEFAINASNRRHWHGPVRAYIDECPAGTKGDRETDFK
jgi:fructose-1,6-bisphosphatase I